MDESIIGHDGVAEWDPMKLTDVMCRLWQGDFVTHHGRYYTVDHARIYTVPPTPPKVYVCALGLKAIEVAARIGDGYISTSPDADLVQKFRELGGRDKPAQGGFKGCYAPTENEAVETAHRLWGTSGIPGELSQVLKGVGKATRAVPRQAAILPPPP